VSHRALAPYLGRNLVCAGKRIAKIIGKYTTQKKESRASKFPLQVSTYQSYLKDYWFLPRWTKKIHRQTPKCTIPLERYLPCPNPYRSTVTVINIYVRTAGKELELPGKQRFENTFSPPRKLQERTRGTKNLFTVDCRFRFVLI
jgi:hypothetical protein